MRVISMVLDKYKKIPEAAKASIAFAVCSILQKGIQLVTIPMFTRLLSTYEYGQYSLYQSWFNIISIFATLNLAAGVFNNGMLKFSDKRDAYISSMQGLATTATGLCFFVYLLNPSMWNELFGLPTIVVLCMFLELFFIPPVSYWSAKQRYEYKYKALVIYTLFISVLNPAVGLIAVSNTEEKGIARILSVCLVNICVGLVFYIINLVRGKVFFSKDYWKFALLFNLPLIPHYLSQVILAQSDRIMIENMFGKSEVAVYSVAYNIGMIMSIITTSINSSFVPWTYESMKAKEYKKIGEISNGLVVLIAVVALVPIMFAPEAVLILGTREYLAAIWVIAPVALSNYLIFLYSLFANIEFYFENSKFVMVASVVAAILNVFLNVLLMKPFGYIAAGYTTLISYMVVVIMHYLFMRKICKAKKIEYEIYDIKFIIMVNIVVVLVSAVFMLTYEHTLLRYALITVCVIVMICKRKFFMNTISQYKKKVDDEK